MNLSSLVVAIKPILPNAKETAPKPPPKWWGRAVHALFLGVVRAKEPNLAEALHASSSLRPFTVSSLFAFSSRRGLEAERLYSFRITTLNDALSALLIRALDDDLAVGAKIELDRRIFEIVGRSVDPNLPNEKSLRFDWAKKSSYEAISAPYLTAKARAPRKIELRFASPTAFKSQGMHQPLPIPAQVFGSLLNRWNAFAPLSFPEEVRRYAEECLAVSRFSLSSRFIQSKGGGVRVGGVGSVTYRAVHFDPYWMSIIALLADFALFSGVGSGINLGMGQCRRVEG